MSASKYLTTIESTPNTPTGARMFCERCGNRRETPHAVPMRRGVWALVCRECYSHILELFRIGKRPEYGLLKSLALNGSDNGIGPSVPDAARVPEAPHPD